MPELSDIDKNNEYRKAVTKLLMSEKRPLLDLDIEHKIGRTIITEKEIVARIECRYWKSYPTGTRTDGIDVYYMLREDLEKFWLNEIEIVLDELKSEMILSDLTKKLSDSFINYYALRHNTYSQFEDISYYKSNVGIQHSYENLIGFIDNNKDKFYKKTDSIYGSNALVKVGLKSWLEVGIFANPQQIIKNEIINSILKKHTPPALALENITFRINRLPIDAGIPKPFNNNLLEKIILDDSDRFKYDRSTGLVELIDDLTYLVSVINKNQFLMKEFNFNLQKAGFLAFTFIGKIFPLKEAIDYVSTRPIIFINTVKNLSNEFSSIIKEDNLFLNEFIEYLTAILQNNTSVNDWINENLTVSFTEFDGDLISKLRNPLISKLSPILNISNNPGNLFQYTLKAKLEEYYNNNPDKKNF